MKCIPPKDEIAVRERLAKLENDILWIKEYLEQHKKSKDLESMMRTVSTLGNGGTIIYLVVKSLGWF